MRPMTQRYALLAGGAWCWGNPAAVKFKMRRCIMGTLPAREKYPEKGYEHNDPSLKRGEGGLTVWNLHEMAKRKQFRELNGLFNNGLNMNSLPVGLAAGAAARVLDIDNKVIADALDTFTGRSWRGKVFFPSNNKSVSEGRNRIKASVLLPHSPIVPMCKFDTMLLDSHPLT